MMQRFLAESPWVDTHRARVLGKSGTGRSDFPPGLSVGVARQYCEAGQGGQLPGRNVPGLCQLGQYLPESWTSDKDRCEAVGVPEDRQGYRSKTELALMLGRVLERGHLRAWVCRRRLHGRPSGRAWRLVRAVRR